MKKVIAILLAILLLMFLFAGCGKQEAEVPVQEVPEVEEVVSQPENDKTIAPAEAFAGGSGTEADPYQINDGAQLALLAESDTAACYILTADIKLNDTADYENWSVSAPPYTWVPIASFSGVFDGNGHTVSGMYIKDCQGDCGLFASVGGTVRNLTVEQAYIAVSGDGNGGAVAGKATGKIENCVFSGIITQTDDSWTHLGGIVGYGGQVSGCVNEGSISGNGYAGGIAGWGKQIENCINKGTVSGDTAGGICGNLYETGTGLEPEIAELGVYKCVNEGEVSALSVAGGIVGNLGNSESDVSVCVSECENNGKVACEKHIAGIVGTVIVEDTGEIRVENCINRADIVGQGKVGGVISELLGGMLHQEGDVTIVGCENYGGITSESIYSAGILSSLMVMGAETDLRLRMQDCINHGDITSNGNAGGIVCVSSSVMATVPNISDDSAITFQNCTNTGSICGLSSNSYVGGIAGNFGVEGVKTVFDSCSNSGEVRLEIDLPETDIQATLEDGFVMTLSHIVGGIVGRLGDSLLLTTDRDQGSEENINAENPWVLFKNCRNTGALEAADLSGYLTEDGKQVWKNYIGGIIGNACGEEAYSFRVEDCTYTGTDRGLGNAEYPDVGLAQ